jgi:hypothetical protein
MIATSRLKHSFLALVLIAGFYSPRVIAAGNAPVGGGGSCSYSVEGDGTVGQQQAYDNGLYTCLSASSTWAPEAFMVGSVLQSGSAATCSSTFAGMLQWTGSLLQYCNGSSWTNIGTAGGSGITLGTSASVTNPQRSGDVTTGEFSPATGAWAVSSGGTEMMRVNATGVGIGTTNQLYTFQVHAGTNLNAAFNNAGSAVNILAVNDAASAAVPLTFQNLTFSVLNSSGNTTRLFVDSSATGNVGIGTTSPTSLLHTVDSAAKTATYVGVEHAVSDTSSTASVNKTGVDIQSTGTWNGTSAVNTGLNVNVSGGTTNYAALFSGGNVGIGTNAPGALLDLYSASSNATMRVGTAQSGGSAYLIFNNTGIPKQWWLGTDLTAAGGGIFQLYDQTAGAARLTVNTTGLVGIGTTAPSALLHVAGANVAVGSGGTGLLQTTTAFNQDVGPSMAFYGDSGSTGVVDFAEIAGRKENGATGNRRGYLQFSTGVSGTPAEAMRINSSGLVSIGGVQGFPTALYVTKSISSSSGVARGGHVATTLTATANNDELTAFRIEPTFTNGAFTGVQNNGLLVTAGNVGIGTTSPGASLEVAGGNIVADNNILVGGTSGVLLRNVSGAIQATTSTQSTYSEIDASQFTAESAGYFLVHGGAMKNSATNNGVGIYGDASAATPGQKNVLELHRANTGAAYDEIAAFALGNTTSTFGPASRLDLNLNQSATNGTTDMTAMTWLASGNVGIGTTSPNATLDVNGYAKLKINASAPVTCDATHEGAIAYTGTTTHYLCYCDGTSWKQASAPGSTCTW